MPDITDGALLVARRELMSFMKSGASGIVIYLLLVPAWGWLMHLNASVGWLWLIFFSVIVCGTASAGVFAAERISGALEILLTSGLHPLSILLGKAAFVSLLGMLLGTLAALLPIFMGDTQLLDHAGEYAVVFAAACIMNTAFDAWVSFRVGNPRLVSVLNLGALFLFLMAGEGLRLIVPWNGFYAAGLMLILALLFGALAGRELHMERVLRPPIL